MYIVHEYKYSMELIDVITMHIVDPLEAVPTL